MNTKQGNVFVKVLTFALMILLAAPAVEAQPGGPGGRPPMGGGNRPSGRRPPMGDWSQVGNDQNANTVKQKKK